MTSSKLLSKVQGCPGCRVSSTCLLQMLEMLLIKNLKSLPILSGMTQPWLKGMALTQQ